MKLEKFMKSNREGKKYTAVFRLNTGRTKTIHFGAVGYEDYTQHHDDDRKKAYINRHKANENWSVPDNAGSLSRWILWEHKNINTALNNFIKKFDLN